MFKLTTLSALALVIAELSVIALAIFRHMQISVDTLSGLANYLVTAFLFLSAATLALFIFSLIFGLVQKLKLPRNLLIWFAAGALLWIPATVAMTMFAY